MDLDNSHILIFGRGATLSHYPIVSDENNSLTIGLNIAEYRGYTFDYHFFPDDFSSTGIFQNIETLYVGSIKFNLGVLLSYINENVSKKTKVGLVGFDFDGYTYDDDILKKTSVTRLQRRINISSQLEALGGLKDSFRNIEVYRFGFDLRSDSDPRLGWAGVSKLKKAESDVEIVAEITTNHHGDTDKLIRLIEGAKLAGADTIKLQKRDVDSFYTKSKLKEEFISPFGNTFRDYRMALELTHEQSCLAANLAKELGLNIFYSTLDLTSFKWALDSGITRVKLPSTISRKKPFLREVSMLDLDEIVISTGMTDKAYEDWILKSFSNVNRLYLLQCTSSYPTYFQDINIGVVRHYSELSKTYPHVIAGLSSHDSGSIGSMMAIAAGAKMIEKHIKVGINEWSHFDDTALDVDTAFRDFIQDLRSAEMIVGSRQKNVLDSEHHKY